MLVCENDKCYVCRHNLHHYCTFFQTVRDAIMSDHSLLSLEQQLQSCDQQQQPISDDQQSCDML